MPSHISEDCCVPPLEKALRLMKEAKVENKWNDVAGMVDIVLEELEKAEQKGDEWGKPVNDPLSYNGENPTYNNKEEFIAKHVDPYVQRHKHLEGYIQDYAKSKEFRQRLINATPPVKAKPGPKPKVDPAEVKQLRDSGMTQQAIADELGVSQKLVSNTLLSINDYNIMDCAKVAPKDTKVSGRQGTSAYYWIARTKRDYPGAYERDEVGPGKKYPTARALAKAMGDIKEKIKIEFPPEESGSQIAGRLFQKLSDQQLMELRDELNEFFRGNK